MSQTMVRVRGRLLSWVDFGGVGPTVPALHGSFGRGAVFAALAQRLRGTVRVVALDQRGHGLADHGGFFTRSEFVADAAAVIDQLGSDPMVVLGHSLGGITAYQLAARHPELVWLASRCPALLLHGQHSTLLSTEMAHQMVRRRPHTQLVTFPRAGHWIHAIAHDRRGHGRSSRPWTGNEMNTYADDLAQLIDTLDLNDVAHEHAGRSEGRAGLH